MPACKWIPTHLPSLQINGIIFPLQVFSHDFASLLWSVLLTASIIHLIWRFLSSDSLPKCGCSWLLFFLSVLLIWRGGGRMRRLESNLAWDHTNGKANYPTTTAALHPWTVLAPVGGGGVSSILFLLLCLVLLGHLS